MLVALALVGCSNAPSNDSTRQAAASVPALDAHPELRGKVQAFFDWYLITGDEQKTVDDVLAKRPQVLDSTLRSLLQADVQCTERTKEVCKLDFDPFVNAQDLCVLYRVAEPRQVAALYEFPVYAGCADDVTDTTPRLIAVVQSLDSGWMFKDVRYSGGRSLVALLQGNP